MVITRIRTIAALASITSRISTAC